MKKKYIDTGRKNQKIETRNRILVSAQYFLNKGKEFNLEDIAKRTGISRATVYRYFSNVDILATEAALDVSTRSPEDLHESLDGIDFEQRITEVQDYFNTLAMDHEYLFRKYLSAVLDAHSSQFKRGARRKKTLKLILEETPMTPKEKEDLANLFTVMMGIEPLIVTKDVCGLNNQESRDLMKWGMELIFKGLKNNRP